MLGTEERSHFIDGIHDIIIRNVAGYSKGRLCYIIRLLPVNARIWNIVIDGVIDTSPDGFRANGVLLLGEHDFYYGENSKDSMRNVTISNVICDSKRAIIVPGYLSDSIICNVINKNPDCPVIEVERKDGLKNVRVTNLCTVGQQDIHGIDITSI